MNSNTTSGLYRSAAGNLFTYYGYSSNLYDDANCERTRATRGVVIVGSGLLYKRSKSFILEEKYLRIFLKVEYKRSIIPSVKKR